MQGKWLMAALTLALASCDNRGVDAPNPAAATGNDASDFAAAQGPAAPETAATGRQFVELAGAADLFEIESARLAAHKAQRTEVREFAAMLLADHRRSSAGLVRAAAQARPAIRVAPSLNAEHQANLQTLNGASGNVFDIVWLRQQVTAHERALSLATDYATNGESDPLRRHAAGVAEPIRRHLARARQLEVPPPR